MKNVSLAATAEADYILSKRESIADEVTTRLLPTLERMFPQLGDHGRAACRVDTQQHVTYLSEAVRAGRYVLFREYVLWVATLLRARGVDSGCLPAGLRVLRDRLAELHPQPAGSVAARYLEAAVADLAAAVHEPHTHLRDGAPHVELARRYLELLLAGDRTAASEAVHAALEDGVSLRDVYLHVFQPTQRELGVLWQTNRISVAEEHFCTAATQMLMCRLYPRVFATPKNGMRFVGACTSGELHEIGIRMITDLLEIEGWDTYFVGARVPIRDVLDAVARHRAHVLGISATMTEHLPDLRAIIEHVRQDSRLSDVKILVGGYPFNIEPTLWRSVGADASAADALEVLSIAETLGRA